MVRPDDRPVPGGNALDRARVRTLDGHRGPVVSVALSADGRRALSGGDHADGTVRVWDVATGVWARVIECGGQVPGLAITPDGRRGAFANNAAGGPFRLWILDLEDASDRMCEDVHRNEVLSVGLSADGRLAVSGSWDCTVRIWDAATGGCLAVLDADGPVQSVAVTPGGRRVVWLTQAGTLRVWDVDRRTCVGSFETPPQTATWSLALSPDGRHAVPASDDGPLRVWSVESGECVRTLQGHTSPVAGVALSADGRLLVSASFASLLVWDLASGRCERTIAVQAGSSVAVSGDGQLAITGSHDGSVTVWSIGR